MRIAVIDLVSVDGGGYQITRSLYDYISAGYMSSHKWLFIVSKQDFESNEFVKVVKYPSASESYWNRAITESIKVRHCLKEFEAQFIISMSNMCVLGCRIPQYIYLQQSIPFQKEKKFSFLKKEMRR